MTPLTTEWLREAGAQLGPVAAYAIVLLGAALDFTILTPGATRAARARLAARAGDWQRSQDLAGELPRRARVQLARARRRQTDDPLEDAHARHRRTADLRAPPVAVYQSTMVEPVRCPTRLITHTLSAAIGVLKKKTRA
ncbi:MAG: hypothetical protein M3P18_19165 [Actinomycetota bacterium]|nr:hypothetical protein [Actinomycetota bacterium]